MDPAWRIRTPRDGDIPIGDPFKYLPVPTTPAGSPPGAAIPVTKTVPVPAREGSRTFRKLPNLITGHPMHTALVADLRTTRFPLLQPTQTMGHQVFVNDPRNRYRRYHPYANPVAPTAACDGPLARVNFSQCAVDTCMWEWFMKPINITTVVPDLRRATPASATDYVTRDAQLVFPHWGTYRTSGEYYPMTSTTSEIDGMPTMVISRATPTGLEQRGKLIYGIPPCTDLESCYDFCVEHARPHLSRDPVNGQIWGIPHYFNWREFGLGCLIFLAFLAIVGSLQLCCCLHDRRRRTRAASQQDTPPNDVVIVNQVTGTATDAGSGQPADPPQATAIVAGSAAGAQAGREKAGEEEKGTTGRRAEEGRSRVNFDEGNAAPATTDAAAPTTTTEVREEKIPPAQQQQQQSTEVHTETRPAGQTDGTVETSTGRCLPDMGSIRGRRRLRPDSATK